MMKKVAIIPIILALAVMMLIYPQKCLDSARYGLELWLVNGRHPERLAELLSTGATKGTRVAAGQGVARSDFS